ncbi:hypothetical protein [Rathayibacter soli]|uniref:hypothetical protein n=1 Tax=Rathayibacter soli TaxID=3144168 RepID=UPI0027E3F482|nr:hypothetical protein [Glaciibacter superstes]
MSELDAGNVSDLTGRIRQRQEAEAAALTPRERLDVARYVAQLYTVGFKLQRRNGGFVLIAPVLSPPPAFSYPATSAAAAVVAKMVGSEKQRVEHIAADADRAMPRIVAVVAAGLVDIDGAEPRAIDAGRGRSWPLTWDVWASVCDGCGWPIDAGPVESTQAAHAVCGQT